MKVRLSKNGPEVSRIVAGVMTWGVWGKKYSTKKFQDLIEHCVSLGITTFDHADIYGHYTTEEDWGKAFKASPIKRKDIQIITKCGIKLVTPNRPNHKVQSYNTSRDHILNSVDTSLANLKTDYIDLLLIHRPDPLMNAREVAEVIAELKQAGKILHFGVSNFTVDQFNLLNAHTPLVTNQVEASLLHTDPINDGTLNQCQQHGIKPMAWSPLGSGKIFGMEQEDILALRAKADEIIERHNQSFHLDQLLLAWLLMLPSGILPVVGTGRKERLEKAAAAVDIKITKEEWFELLEAALGHPVA